MTDALQKVANSSRAHIEALVGNPYTSPAQTEKQLNLSIKEAVRFGHRFDDISDASGYRPEDVHRIVEN